MIGLTRDRANWLRVRLEHIAALDDHLANVHLAQTGSYGAFDEPGSVEVAREILAELKELNLPTG